MNEDDGRAPLSELTEAQIALLWEKYYPRLRASIAERVQRMHRPVASNSEIALSAFHSLVKRAKDGQFPELSDEAGFWKLLRTIAVRKANDVQKKLWASKRGGELSPIGQADAESNDGSLSGGVAGAPDLDRGLEELELSEVFNKLLEQLPNERHRDVILLKLQGADTQEIADCLSTTQRTVQRLLKNIRQEWEQELTQL